MLSLGPEEELTDPDGKPDSSRPSLPESSRSDGKLESSRTADKPAKLSPAPVDELTESDDKPDWSPSRSADKLESNRNDDKPAKLSPALWKSSLILLTSLILLIRPNRTAVRISLLRLSQMLCSRRSVSNWMPAKQSGSSSAS